MRPTHFCAAPHALSGHSADRSVPAQRSSARRCVRALSPGKERNDLRLTTTPSWLCSGDSTTRTPTSSASAFPQLLRPLRHSRTDLSVRPAAPSGSLFLLSTPSAFSRPSPSRTTSSRDSAIPPCASTATTRRTSRSCRALPPAEWALPRRRQAVSAGSALARRAGRRSRVVEEERVQARAGWRSSWKRQRTTKSVSRWARTGWSDTSRVSLFKWRRSSAMNGIRSSSSPCRLDQALYHLASPSHVLSLHPSCCLARPTIREAESG